MKLVEKFLENCQRHQDAAMVEVLSTQGTEGVRSYSYAQMLQAARQVAAMLPVTPEPTRVGLVMRNSPEWVATDLGLLLAGHTEIPVPLAFAAEQAWHLLRNADLCLVDAAGQARLLQWQEQNPAFVLPALEVIDITALLQRPQPPEPAAPVVRDADYICKIIHTSGTTSAPKGVKIRAAGIDALITSLDTRLTPRNYARYASVVPLSLLIEQVLGVYMSFFDGGTVVFMPPEVAVLGEAGGSMRGLMPMLPLARPTMLIGPPILIEALLAACRAVPDASQAARYQRLFGHSEEVGVGVGGAPIAQAVLQELMDFGITVLEGYGLSENGSVVSSNAPGNFRLGTVGRPLDHVEVKIGEDGELLVRSSSLFAGYAGTDPSSCEVDADNWLHTGDIAAIDADGFIRIFGRKKHLIITAKGRNVSPEWVESNYKSLDCVEAAVIFGDRLEQLYGFFVIAPGVDAANAEAQIRAYGLQHLSEVERVEVIVCVASQGSVYGNYFTVTGRPQRDKIWQYLQTLLPTPPAGPAQS
jgi:long-subunit acyl-CoA synthetase (AMP-forming)